MRSRVLPGLFVVFASLIDKAAFAQPAPDPTTDLVLSSGTMNLSGVQRFRNVCITGTATLNVTNYNGGAKNGTGNLELIAGSIFIGPNAKIVARGAGYQPALCSDGRGPNGTAGGRGGCSVQDSGGGGAHFGRGGRGTVDDPLGTNFPWKQGFPTAFEDDCNIDFNGTTCAVTGAPPIGQTNCTDGMSGRPSNPSNPDSCRTFCWQNPLHPLNSTVGDSPTCANPPCVGASVAGVEYWHNIYDPEFGAAGGDKGCRDGDGTTGNPMAGAGGGRVVLVALDERNGSGAASPCGGVQGKLEIQGTIDANGKRGCGVGNDSGGGGGGGSVLLVGKNVVVGSAAVIKAAGGLGGDTDALTSPDGADCPSGTQAAGGTCDDCGGGGGGGIISVLSVTSSLDPGATFNVAGALGGKCTICNGEAGGGAGELQLDGAYVGEYCDGFDNNFDGQTDEDLGTQSCGLGSCAQPIDACDTMIGSSTRGQPKTCTPMVNPNDVSCMAADVGARPRIAVILDTSASMLLDLAGYPTFGDGSLEHPGRDSLSDADSVANDSRLQLARESLAQVMSAYPEIDFALARYHQDQAMNRACQDAKWFECQGLVGTYDDPTGNTGTLNPACAVVIGPDPDGPDPDGPGPMTSMPAPTVTVNPIPGPPGSQCINYAGSCGPPRRGADILSGFGSKVRDMVRWLDGKETNFDADMTPGDVCNHSDGVHDCEVRGSGPTPLAGSLQAIQDYMNPIKATDSAAACRGYSVILLTDGAESCNGNPATAAASLLMSGVKTYVVAVSTLPSEQASLNAIAASGGTTTATFVSMPQQLVPALTGIIAGAIKSEKCNGADDDCDGKIDEDFPGLGVACDDGEKGVCKGEGVISCNTAETGTECKLTTNGGSASTEVCNSLDDDCDGKVDETLDCDDTPCTPTGSEVCNAVDDDCDDKVDEADPNLGHECGKNIGVCTPGMQRCVAGMLRCVGGVMPGVEICNGKDDDCDGEIDNEAPCPEGNACIEGACRRECDPSIEFPCPVGYLCKPAPTSTGSYCVPGACALCKSTEVCRDDTCVDPCDGVECANNEKCVLGNCKDCTQLGCPNGEICFDGVCQEDACRNKQCSDDEFCFKGECLPFCDSDKCAAGERCNEAGECERDRCAGVACDAGEVCRGGKCSTDPCAELTCNLGDVCVGEMGCIPDPCALTKCPRGAECLVSEAGLPVCSGPPRPDEPRARYIGGGGSGLSTCTVTHPSGGAPVNAGWWLVPALVWGARRRRARRVSQQSQRAG
jgi:Putative metal-binding motif